jgi:hypothetical protein
MIITLVSFGFILLILLIGRINLSTQFRRKVKELFLISKDISANVFWYNQLAGLPEPVQRYFKHVLKEGQPYISFVSLKHDGQFKTGIGKKWINIKGEQYFTTEKPGFIWKGSTKWFAARDMFISGKGRLVVTLLSLFNILDGKGEQYNQGELLRWLGESVWFPTNLLPDKSKQWSYIDSHSAKLKYNINGLSLFFIVTFNVVGEITQMETKRYFDENILETWICKMSNYKEMNNIYVPTITEAIWKLETGDHSYAKFNVIIIKYHKSN